MSVTNIADACVVLFLFGLVVVVGAFLEEAAASHLEERAKAAERSAAKQRREEAANEHIEKQTQKKHQDAAARRVEQESRSTGQEKHNDQQQ